MANQDGPTDLAAEALKDANECESDNKACCTDVGVCEGDTVGCCAYAAESAEEESDEEESEA